MKYSAKVTIINTDTVQGKADPNKTYNKVLVMQGVETSVFICKTDEVFELCKDNIGCNVVIETDYSETYKRMSLENVLVDC